MWPACLFCVFCDFRYLFVVYLLYMMALNRVGMRLPNMPASCRTPALLECSCQKCCSSYHWEFPLGLAILPALWRAVVICNRHYRLALCLALYLLYEYVNICQCFAVNESPCFQRVFRLLFILFGDIRSITRWLVFFSLPRLLCLRLHIVL